MARPKESRRSAPRPVLVGESVGASDQEARLAAALVAPALEAVRQVERAESLAFLVEQDRDAVFPRRGNPAAASGNSLIRAGQEIRFR